jgi:DNA-binding transcriptional LysR family regulator
MIAENRIFNLTKREADMAVRIARPREPHVVVRKIGELANALYASKAYVAARGTPRGDLAGHEVVAWDDTFSQIDEARWLATRGKGAKVALRTSSTIAQLHAATSGIGLAVLPCYLADPEPDLVRLPQPEACPLREIWLAVHPDVRHAARIRAASDFIVEAVKARSAELLGQRRRRA